MQENINQAATGGDFYIWIVTFSILLIGVGYLVYVNKDIER
jgi:hypothetical protein